MVVRPVLPLSTCRFPALSAAVLVLSAAAFSTDADADDLPRDYAVRAGKVYTVADGVIEAATIIVRDGRFEAVGVDLAVPSDLEVFDLPNHVIIPGLVDAETTLASDLKDTQRSIAPEVKALDGWDFFGERKSLLKGGVTSVYVAPGIPAHTGREVRLISGRGGVVKTAGFDHAPRLRVLKESSGVQVSLGVISRTQPSVYDPPVRATPDNPFEVMPRQLPQSRAGEYLALRRLFRRAKAYSGALRSYSTGESACPEWDVEAGGLYRLFDGTDHLRVRANKAHDIFRMTQLAKEYGLRMVLEGGLEAWKVIPFLLESNVPVIVAGSLRPGRIPAGDLTQLTTEGQFDEKGFLRLARAGVKVILNSPTDREIKDLLLQAATAVGIGMRPDDALRAITLTPAEVLGVADRVGSITAGKDADFVVLGGEPFGQEGRPRAVVINGEVVYQEMPIVEGGATVIRCGRILTGTGRAIVGGMIIIKDGKIEYVGPGSVFRHLDRAAQTIDASASTVVPGLIDCGSTAGTHAESLIVPLAAESGSRGARGTSTFRLADSVDPNDPALRELVEAGITTVLISPEPSGTISGQVSALKVASADPEKAILREYAAMLFGGTSTQEVKKAKDYHDRWKTYEEEKRTESPPEKPEVVDEGDKNEVELGEFPGSAPADKNGDEKKPPAKVVPKKPLTEPKREEKYEPFRRLFEGKVAAVIPATSLESIESVLKVFHGEYGMRLILSGLTDLSSPEDFSKAAEAIRRAGASVLLVPPFVSRVERRVVNAPKEWADRGIAMEFRSRAATGGRFLALQVAYAVREGLDSRQALHAMTYGAARTFGVDERVGSIDTGKDADLVFLSGEPFSITTRVMAVMVDGRMVYEVKHEEY